MNQKKRDNRDGIAYISFFGSIEEESVKAFFCKIMELPEDTHTIYILLSTGGGDVSAGFAMYNLLRALPQKIIMHNIGSVDSIGNTIFLAADERYACGNGTFLIHRVKSTAKNENVEEGYIQEKLSCIQGEEKKIRDVLLSRTKISESELNHFFEMGQLKDAEYALQVEMVQEIRELEIPSIAALHIV